MGAYFHALWTDQTMFIGLVRGLFGVLGVMAETGQLNAVLQYLPEPIAASIGVVFIFIALFMRSSSSSSVPANPKP